MSENETTHFYNKSAMGVEKKVEEKANPRLQHEKDHNETDPHQNDKAGKHFFKLFAAAEPQQKIHQDGITWMIQKVETAADENLRI